MLDAEQQDRMKETLVSQSQGEHTLLNLFFSFLRLGITAFGGPAMIAYIRKMAVIEKHWLDEDSFQKGTALCQSLPGATAMQVAAYVGFRGRGVQGALLSYVGFGLPAFLLMLIFSLIYLISHDLSWMKSLFAGLQVIVVALVAVATYTFGKASLKRSTDIIVAAASTTAYWIGVNPFLIIIGAAAAGTYLFWEKKSSDSVSIKNKIQGRPYIYAIAFVALVLAVLSALYFLDPRLFNLALLMLKVDLIAFGGGFSSLPLLLHEVVQVNGWMDSKT
ncbi:MAG TPA: chromate efflux transporter, partial [Desulfomonilia bacterium]|nr:chromate efflux transporter [Desulfomonilia bacterium]